MSRFRPRCSSAAAISIEGEGVGRIVSRRAADQLWRGRAHQAECRHAFKQFPGVSLGRFKRKNMRFDLLLRKGAHGIADGCLGLRENHMHSLGHYALTSVLSFDKFPVNAESMQDVSPFKSAAQREADRTAKREAVLRAAVRMFNERGFFATSLDDVAASLGISKRTIYHYLANKDQVLLECVTIGLQQLLQAAEEARVEAGTGRDRLAKFLRRYAEINMDDFGRCVIRTGEEALSRDSLPRYRALKREIDIAMRSMLNEAVEDGTIGGLDVRMAAFTIAGALNWPARWHDPDGPLKPSEIAKTMVDILLRGLDARK